MARKVMVGLLVACLVATAGQVVSGQDSEQGWISLFDGRTLTGWKASENKATFSVQNGTIVAKGPRSHLFYVGPVENADFKNFEFKADVMTKPSANSGMYFHTEYQETDWPAKGYEVQVNNTHSDWRKTASLYGVKDVRESSAKDNEWFTQHIIVKGKQITIKVNGKTINEYTEPEEVGRSDAGRKLSRGTFALQGHDPGSTIFYKNIMVKPLPDETLKKGTWVSLFNGKSLDGWEQINGTARYEVKDGTITGTTAEGSPNSFLCTKKHYGDFELDFEVKLDSRLNSGVQIRSNSFREYRNGRVHGYQVEIATNGNAGRIYDEARRAGWLNKEGSDEDARKAFKEDEWNRFHVLCLGDTIKTWVNDVPVADVVDSMTRTGFIGLQVHSFKGDTPAWVQWRNIRIRELTPVIPKKSIRVVVVTGGHGFEHEPFFKIFEAVEEIDYAEAVQKDHSELFEDVSGWNYDVMVLYNMTQNISEKRQENFLKLLDKGVGVVALHHTLGAYQQWPEFRKVIGGKYYLKDTTEDGVLYKQGAYQHDLDVKVYVKDKTHAITQGMADFAIHDETYKNCWSDEGNHVLLTTDHPTSDETIGWVRKYGKAKVCTIQLGHDSKAYQNANYRLLVKRAILWAAGKL